MRNDASPAAFGKLLPEICKFRSSNRPSKMRAHYIPAMRGLENKSCRPEKFSVRARKKMIEATS